MTNKFQDGIRLQRENAELRAEVKALKIEREAMREGWSFADWMKKIDKLQSSLSTAVKALEYYRETYRGMDACLEAKEALATIRGEGKYR